jgi:hypothetical protein
MPGSATFPPKKTPIEYNRLSQEWVPPQIDDKYRFLCDTWVKYNAGTPRADELYRLAQDKSRVLNGKGSGLKRAEIDKLRFSTGE